MPRDYPRSRRIEDQIQRILSDVLRTDVRDPRLGKVIITAVRVSRDLSVAWVYYTLLQAEGEPEALDDAFAGAMGFLRSRLAKELTVRRVPELRFELDETEAQARSIDKLLSDVGADKTSNNGEEDSGSSSSDT